MADITEHKGTTRIQSKQGKGATSVVELHIAADTRQQPGAKILIIDDETIVPAFLQHLLAKDGYQIKTVNTASAALERTQKDNYDLIFLDTKMPHMSGIESYRHIEESAAAT